MIIKPMTFASCSTSVYLVMHTCMTCSKQTSMPRN
jgi:hypothetical protein